jgi:hypothetical protein
MGRFIPVDPEKWAAMVIAQSDLVRYKEICDELDAECTRIKDENARLRSFCTRTIIPNIDLEKEVTRLKAEVERLKEGNECLDQMHEKEMARSAFLCEEVNRTTAWGRGLESDLSWARAELLMVKAEVERLTKAGDAMVPLLGRGDWHIARNDWNAAKEGKQS